MIYIFNHLTVNKVYEYQSNTKSERIIFILRRAIWLRKCKRADVMRVFGVSSTQATHDLDLAVQTFTRHIRRTKSGVVPIPGSDPPPEASAKRLFSLINPGGDIRELGFDNDNQDGPFTRPSMPYLPDERILSDLLRARINSSPLEVQYVSLRPNEHGRWIDILPLRFEMHNEQWKMTALDLGSRTPEGLYIAKRFIMARITDTRPSITKVKTKSIDSYFSSVRKKLKIQLNPRLTPNQKMVVRREIGINENDLIVIDEADLFELRRKYCDSQINRDAPGSQDVVWPLITDIKEVG